MTEPTRPVNARPRPAPAAVHLDLACQALAHRARRGILHLLAVHRELGRASFDEAFPAATSSALSQHLAVLRRAGLVTVQRNVFDRRELRYRLAPGALLALRAWLDEHVLGYLPLSREAEVD
jgi:DNA-binding transcriptional ArsR family regulator